MFEVNDDDFFFDDTPSQVDSEDSILPDDFNQETTEEQAESVEETPNTEEVSESAQDPDYSPFLKALSDKAKYNKAPVNVESFDDVVEKYQMGLNYPKLQEKLNTLQSDPRLSFVDEMARESGMNTDEFLRAVREQREQARLNELVQQNIPEEYAKEILENRKFREQLQAKEKSQQEEQAKQAQYQEFLQAYPDLDPQKIPNEVWEMYQNGRPLVDAYTRYENQQLKQQLQVLKQNQTNAQRAAVGSVTQHGAQEIAPEDDFMRGFNSI